MMLHTVRVSLTSYFQNLSAYNGTMSFRLNRKVTTPDGVVFPLVWQTVAFGDEGDTSIDLIPNELLGEDTSYVFEIRKAPKISGKSELVASGGVFIPDRDCDLLDIAVFKPKIAVEDSATAQGYASQAMQTYEATKNLVDGFDRLVDDAKDEIGAVEEGVISGISSATSEAIGSVQEEGRRVSDSLELKVEGVDDSVREVKEARDAAIYAVDTLDQQRIVDKAEVLANFAKLTNQFNRHLIDVAGGLIDG